MSKFLDHDYTANPGGDTELDRVWNRRWQPGQGNPGSTPQTVEQNMQSLLDEVKRNSVDAEDSLPLFPQVGVRDRQILLSLEVPIEWNNVVLSVYGGVIAATIGRPFVDPTDGTLVADGQTFSMLFGANGFIPGDQLVGADFTPIVLGMGPQQWPTINKAVGQVLTLWVHPLSRLAERAAIETSSAQVVMVGEVQRKRA